MLFHSFEFTVFFTIVFIAYWLIDHNRQNWLLLIASYMFYAAWDARFLLLILISTIIDFYCGMKIYEAKKESVKKTFLIFSIAANLIILGFFKYYNFFAENIISLLNAIGLNISSTSINIILPLGISFYTFQTLSYTIDVFNNRIKPIDNFRDYSLFVAFFPQLIAGPIERASDLLPQIQSSRSFSLEHFNRGCFLILWGVFLKVFVADNMEIYVNNVFALRDYSHLGENVLLGMYSFSMQIFCDFAGYSSMAKGLARCLGFELITNFHAPYFSSNPREFWRRWHISLSTWLRDYIYIPLGGSRMKNRVIINIFITLLLGGLWHGAAWMFIIWGFYHALLLSIHRLWMSFSTRLTIFQNNYINKILTFFNIILMFNLVSFSWIFFRARSLEQAFHMIMALFFSWNVNAINTIQSYLADYYLYLAIPILVQFIEFYTDDSEFILKCNIFTRSIFYYGCIILIIIFGQTNAQRYIYFQF